MRGVMLCALALTSACAANKAPEVLSQRDLQRMEIGVAKQQIAAYLRARNDSGLKRLMTTDAILDLPAGDVLWSPGAILQTLGYMRQVSIEDVTLSPVASVVCEGAAFEFGDYSARVKIGDSNPEVRSGGYRLQWRALPDGSMRVNRIGLATSARRAKAGHSCGST